MSRIDDALNRLAGVVAPEPRVPSVLDRYASEGRPVVEEPKKDARLEARLEERRPTSFTTAGPRPMDSRPAPAKPVSPPHVEALPDGEPDVESTPLVNVRQLVDYVGFAGRSVGRHKLLAASTVILVVSLTGAAALVLPKTYHVQTKLLAQRNEVMAALSNPGRAVPWDADAPTRAAAETVLRRDNLVQLIKQTDLMAQWERNRTTALRAKDWVIAKIARHTPTPEEKLDRMVGLLENRMHVDAGPVGDGTVTIDLTWPDPDMAYKLVQGAQSAFLEARQAAETAAIGESISILERYSGSLHEDINRTLTELQRAQAATAAAAPRPRPAVRAAVPAAAAVTASLPPSALDGPVDSTPVLNRMKTTIASKKLELSKIEDARERRLTDLQAQLGQLKTVYTANHPSVLSVEQNIAAVSQQSPQARALSTEIDELQTDYDKRLADATDEQIKGALGRPATAAPAPTVFDPRPAEDRTADQTDRATSPTSEFVRLRLRSELNQLESVLERTDGARIELAVSQAAFKYRYTVIRPAQVPRAPVFPNLTLIFAAGIFGSLVLALSVVIAKDLLSKRILEPWQVERTLGLPVLGTLRTA